MYQFFVDDSQIGEEKITILGEDVNHIKNVLRMKAGSRFESAAGWVTIISVKSQR